MSTFTQIRPDTVPLSPAAPVGPPVESARMARTFAVNVVGRILEVLDGRRPCEHLTPAVSEEVFAQVALALRRREDVIAHAPMRGPTARLRRMHLQMASATAANYFGTVERGLRTRAVAGRVELHRIVMPGRRAQTRWMLAEFGIV
ncbi:Rv3235 family protein [Gordonia humi]|uniref:Uncharacterized protein n=1 Tax=Gordonia humi TaxID=686429 RepID=A0A840F7S4_9ACTN|nr:Rv3235 family protein [Gordonia humi]MBB4137629.1 hypothetical protein [Gordonia humi]